MSTPSSKYTRFSRRGQARRPDPRMLPDEVVAGLGLLAHLHGTGSGKGHPSSRRERRAALKALRLYAKVRVGFDFDFGRQTVRPKYSHRAVDYRRTVADCLHATRRKGG